MPDEWLTAKECADELRVNIDTIRNWINNPDPEKRLPAVKAGRDWRIQRKDWEEFLNKRKNIRDEDE
jgi:excisionase family DNA binding protein